MEKMTQAGRTCVSNMANFLTKGKGKDSERLKGARRRRQEVSMLNHNLASVHITKKTILSKLRLKIKQTQRRWYISINESFNYCKSVISDITIS